MDQRPTPGPDFYTGLKIGLIVMFIFYVAIMTIFVVIG